MIGQLELVDGGVGLWERFAKEKKNNTEYAGLLNSSTNNLVSIVLCDH